MPTPSERNEANTLNIDLIVSSFLKIEPQFNEFAETFYYILFKECPGMIPLFSRTDMEKQKSKLIESVRLLISNIHNPEAFAYILKSLGHRHVWLALNIDRSMICGDRRYSIFHAIDRGQKELVMSNYGRLVVWLKCYTPWLISWLISTFKIKVKSRAYITYISCSVN